MAKIGLKKACYAKVVSDDEGAIAYGDIIALRNMQEINVNPIVNKKKIDADDLVIDDISECLGADLTVKRDEFLPSEEAEILGRIVDEFGGVYGGNFDDAPFVAFGYMRTFRNSNVGLYVWIFKTRFAPSSTTAKTKSSEGIDPQSDSYSASSITRTADGAWIYTAKSSDPNFGDTFFSKATLERLKPTSVVEAIELSTIAPADGEVGVAVSENVVITFNNKIAVEAITVIKEDGTLVAGAKSWDAAGKVLTFNPALDLDAATTYIVAINGVKDYNGQTLASVAKSFTTA